MLFNNQKRLPILQKNVVINPKVQYATSFPANFIIFLSIVSMNDSFSRILINQKKKKNRFIMFYNATTNYLITLTGIFILVNKFHT